MDPRIHSFLKNLINTAHEQEVQEDLANKMIADLEIQLEGKINGTIIDSLDEENQNVYVNMLNNKTPEKEINKFLEEKIPDIKEKMQKTFTDFEQDYITFIKQA